MREASTGKPLDRVDGPLKVRGRAAYAYENGGKGRCAYGVIVPATIARGRVIGVDTGAAERAPGVLAVLTKDNAPTQAPWGPADLKDRFARAVPALDNDLVRHFGYPVACVLADTLEAATGAAAMVHVRYAEEPGSFDLVAARGQAEIPETVNGGKPAVSRIGDFDQAFGEAPVTVDATYTTPIQNHAAIEPHASTASWAGGKLTIHNSAQKTTSPQQGIARTLKMPEDDVRLITRFIGGGFGGKLPYYQDATLAAIGARQLGRPVKLALTRQQIFHLTSHRTMSEQRVRLGATRDGRLVAYGQDALVHAARFDVFTEDVCGAARMLYAAPNRLTRHARVKLDLPRSDSMRAPGDGIGLLALECAVDELAEKLGMDPVALRIANDSAVNPEDGKPFSSRNLVRALEDGARRFGWDRRATRPAARAEGRWLIGMGVASAIRADVLQEAKARIELARDGTLSVWTAMTDIGTGTYTIAAQVAADAAGVPVDRVRVYLGDTRYPPSAGSGGSYGATTTAASIEAAAAELVRAMAASVVADRASPLAGADPSQVVRDGDRLIAGDRSEPIAAIARRAGPFVAEGGVTQKDRPSDYAHAGFGAHFAEVAVHRDTGETRVRRMLGVFAVGRILNPKTARSQMLGGMIWGLGNALMEENKPDPRYGSLINQDLAQYHVAAHADVPAIEIMFLEEDDSAHGNPTGTKGVGELGICGAGAAVANAVYNACGARIRDFPITLDKLLPTLEALDAA